MRPLWSGALLRAYLILLLLVKPPSMLVTSAGILGHLTPWKKRPATLLLEPLTLCTPLLGRREALRRLHLSVGKCLCSVNPRTLSIHVRLTAVSWCLRQGTCRKPLPFALVSLAMSRTLSKLSSAGTLTSALRFARGCSRPGHSLSRSVLPALLCRIGCRMLLCPWSVSTYETWVRLVMGP